MKRFHIALAVDDLENSIKDYSQRLEQKPTVVVAEKYAMWRTDTLNFSINQIPERAGELRHLGFEDEAKEGFSSDFDTNGLEWETSHLMHKIKRSSRCMVNLAFKPNSEIQQT